MTKLHYAHYKLLTNTDRVICEIKYDITTMHCVITRGK